MTMLQIARDDDVDWRGKPAQAQHSLEQDVRLAPSNLPTVHIIVTSCVYLSSFIQLKPIQLRCK